MAALRCVLCCFPVLPTFICSCDYAAFDLIYLYARIALIYGNLCRSYYSLPSMVKEYDK